MQNDCPPWGNDNLLDGERLEMAWEHDLYGQQLEDDLCTVTLDTPSNGTKTPPDLPRPMFNDIPEKEDPEEVNLDEAAEELEFAREEALRNIESEKEIGYSSSSHMTQIVRGKRATVGVRSAEFGTSEFD